jgi:hypothetical protein
LLIGHDFLFTMPSFIHSNTPPFISLLFILTSSGAWITFFPLFHYCVLNFLKFRRPKFHYSNDNFHFDWVLIYQLCLSDENMFCFWVVKKSLDLSSSSWNKQKISKVTRRNNLKLEFYFKKQWEFFLCYESENKKTTEKIKFWAGTSSDFHFMISVW